ncbi:MAG: hypothetical protein NT062_14565 [Proteobacteria bacterium]|nr:hypothetical protein [Pseudomonadota bacterium]
MADTWLKCSACRTEIAFDEIHWVCSVSTCNRNRTRLVFCSVACWDSHVAMLRHREAWAVEARSPSRAAWERELAVEAAKPLPPDKPPAAAPIARPAAVAMAPTPAPAPVLRRVVDGGSAPVVIAATPVAPTSAATDVVLKDAEREMLIVVSKLKKYIKDRSGFNCSDAVADILSEHVRAICDEAIRTAGRDERKTVLDRDVPRPRR